MKRPGEPVTLRLAWGEPPEVGDVLLFRTGRRYLVLDVVGKRIETVVLDPSDKTERPVKEWRWVGRARS